MNNLIKTLAEGVMGLVLDDNLFVDMFGNVSYLDENNVPIRFDPLTDWNDCMMLVEQMVEDGYILDVKWKSEIFSASFFNYDGPKKGYDWSRKSEHEQIKPLDAICIAIAEAKGLEYE